MVSIIIPACNEGENIRRFAGELLPPLQALPVPFELVIVDDGSTDDTVLAALALKKLYPATTILSHPRNLGLGQGVRTGIAAAKGDVIVAIDADLTFSPKDIPLLYDTWQKTGADCVIGSHFIHKKGFMDVPPHRIFLSRAVNLMYQLLLKQHITAVSSIFRLYKKSALLPLSLEADGFTINAEILLRLIQNKTKIVEVPVILSTRQFGISKLRTVQEIKNHLVMLGKIIKWKLTNKL